MDAISGVASMFAIIFLALEISDYALRARKVLDAFSTAQDELHRIAHLVNIVCYHRQPCSFIAV